MTEQQTTLAELAMQAAREMAIAFGLPEDQTDDAVSTAWEFAQTAEAAPQSIAFYAIKRVRSSRRFRESVRSIDSPKRARNLNRSPIEIADLARPGVNPASLVAIKIDFEAWLHNLPERMRQIANALACGESTGILAKRLRVSPGRISQIRRELEQDWREFVG